MLWATARSVREEKSKQRHALQDFSFVRVSLVKGKTGWRIGSVEALGNPFLQASSRQERAHVNFVVTQLRRYIHGEHTLPETYEDVQAVLTSPVLIARQQVCESIFLLRLLYVLGYVAKKETFSSLIESEDIATALSLYTEAHAGEIEKVTLSAGEISHL